MSTGEEKGSTAGGNTFGVEAAFPGAAGGPEHPHCNRWVLEEPPMSCPGEWDVDTEDRGAGIVPSHGNSSCCSFSPAPGGGYQGCGGQHLSPSSPTKRLEKLWLASLNPTTLHGKGSSSADGVERVQPTRGESPAFGMLRVGFCGLCPQNVHWLCFYCICPKSWCLHK